MQPQLCIVEVAAISDAREFCIALSDSFIYTKSGTSICYYGSVLCITALAEHINRLFVETGRKDIS